MADMRVGGLASGMDIDSIVKDLMRAERLPLDKLEQDRTWLTWQRDAYREMNSLLFELDSLAFDMKLSSAYQSKTVASSNDAFVTATAGSGAANGSHTIEVTQVASAASIFSFRQNGPADQGISSNSTNKLDPNASLWEQIRSGKFLDSTINWELKEYKNADIKVGKNGGDSFKLAKGALNGTNLRDEVDTITVKDKDGNETSFEIVPVFSDFDSTAPTEGQVAIDINTGKMKFGTKLEEGSTIVGPTYKHNTFSFSFKTYDENGNVIEDDPENPDGKYDFEFDATTTLNQVMTKISNSNVGISAFYDSYSDKVNFQRTATGDLNPNGVEMGMEGNFLLKVLGMENAVEEAPKDAKFTIDGLTTQRKSNTFTINGVTYSLKAEGTSTVSVEDNTEASFDKIKEFVDKYNEIIGKINDKLREERYRDYKPLTDEQKKDMSENEIELWEERAKSGLLRGDSILSSALSQMRRAFYSQIDTGDGYTHLSEIGIKTSSDYMSGGKLEISESKLKEALAKDSEAIFKLFSNDVDGDGRGIMNRLEDSIQSTMDRIEGRAGKSTQTLQQYTLGRRLDDLNDRIDSFQDRLITIEDRYWRQFGAMEKAISRMNQQSMFLMNSFSGGM